MIGLADANDPLLRAKSLLAQELPMALVAQQVGLPLARIRRTARKENWIRRSRRDPYSPTIRAQALLEYARCGSMTKAAKIMGVARQTLMRWVRAATPIDTTPVILWRCYECSPFGRKVEGDSCPSCGTIRRWATDTEELLN